MTFSSSALVKHAAYLHFMSVILLDIFIITQEKCPKGFSFTGLYKVPPV